MSEVATVTVQEFTTLSVELLIYVEIDIDFDFIGKKFRAHSKPYRSATKNRSQLLGTSFKDGLEADTYGTFCRTAHLPIAVVLSPKKYESGYEIPSNIPPFVRVVFAAIVQLYPTL